MFAARLKVTKFYKWVITQCNCHQLAEQITYLQTLPTLDKQNLLELNATDTQLTKICLTADQTCSLKQLHPWSPELNQAYLWHWLWNLALSAHRNQHDMSDILQSIWAHLLLSLEDTEEPLSSLLANLWHSEKHLRQGKCKADQLWRQHLEAILNARAVNSQKKTSALTYLIQAEQNWWYILTAY